MCVVDTCAVWNMLSSRIFNQAAVQSRLFFCITPFVLHECSAKRSVSPAEQQEQQKELLTRLQIERTNGRFSLQGCSVNDLAAVSAAAPGKLGAGELSCIAVAYGIRSMVFMSDDKAAKKYAEEKLNLQVESTPRLYGYLHYHRHLGDSDHSKVIQEHELFEQRPLTKFLEVTFNQAMHSRLMENLVLVPHPTPT